MLQQQTQVGPVKIGNPDILVQRFFRELGYALTTGNLEGIKSSWGIPSFVLGNSAELVVKSPAEVERFFAGTKTQYNQQGIIETVPEIESIQWLTSKIALVGVRWPYFDQEGFQIGEEASCYTLKLDNNNQLRIYSVVLQGESSPQETH